MLFIRTCGSVKRSAVKGNRKDPYAIALKKDGSVVGHAFNLFHAFVLYLFDMVATL